MKTIFADKHVLHDPGIEVDGGRIETCAEKPSRTETVRKAIADNNIGAIIAPGSYGIDKITAIHNADYIEFLRTAHGAWLESGREGPAFATNFNSQHHSQTPPQAIGGRMGFYICDTSVSLTAGSWEAAEQGAHAALTALDCVIGGDKAAFSLSRPPGHHASAGMGGGYCLLNNAAIAAQAFIDGGHGQKVAILDVDYHHGNGTQDIFYQRSDVLYASLHADPAVDFPYFLGYAQEIGAGAGAGFNHNYPMPLGTTWERYREALRNALQKINDFGADLLIVSLGVDTYKDDPISQFKLDSPDYITMGADIAGLSRPTLFVMEGGYAVDAIGTNVVNTLNGYSGS
ncbi:MAG: histone deacetylase family protein [Alphaproteobacteria bacterium]|nr:histone deacetylase family protein [Alphaproteobacteria bacterium]MBU0858918.1 histone deacetylase family protein [Alphaproteobacteria bacterium]